MHNKTSCLQKVAILLWLLPAFWWGWVLPCLLLPICSPICQAAYLSCPHPRIDWQALGQGFKMQVAEENSPLCIFSLPLTTGGEEHAFMSMYCYLKNGKTALATVMPLSRCWSLSYLKNICNSAVMLEDSTWTSINLWLGQYLQSALYIELVCFLTYQGFSFNWVILTQIGRELRHMTIGGLQQSVRKVMLLSNIEQLKN